MGDRIRPNKGPPFGKRLPGRTGPGEPRANEMFERRPLKTVRLSPPNYHIDPLILKESFVEKEVRFAGILTEIPVELDTTNRTDVLRYIDWGKREQKIPWQTTTENDAIVSISVNNIKISRRDPHEETLLRVPMHDIAAICYIRDDSIHILTIKYGDQNENPDTCSMAIMNCDSKHAAEELCALVSQCFELVFTEATLQFVDNNISQAANGLTLAGSTTSQSDYSNSSTPKREAFYDPTKPSFLSQSHLDLEEGGAYGGGTLSTSTLRLAERMTEFPAQRKQSVTNSESEFSNLTVPDPPQENVIQEYMKKLQTKLNAEELKRFALLLKKRESASGMSIQDFCQQVLELYGPNRKYLLAGMKPFFLPRDYEYFESFLESIGEANSSYNNSPVIDFRQRRYRRTVSGTSMFTESVNDNYPLDEFDRAINTFSEQIATLGSSVDINTDPDIFAPKPT